MREKTILKPPPKVQSLIVDLGVEIDYRILGIDPGKNFATAVLVPHQKGLKVAQTHVAVDDREDAAAELMFCLDRFRPDFVVLEDFIGAGVMTNDGRTTLKCIGLVEGVLNAHPAHWDLRMRRNAKRMKALPHVAGIQNRHCRDAAAHAVAFAMDELQTSPV